MIKLDQISLPIKYTDEDILKGVEKTLKINKSNINSFEILKYHWYKVGDSDYKISSAIRDHFLPFAISEGLIY